MAPSLAAIKTQKQHKYMYLLLCIYIHTYIYIHSFIYILINLFIFFLFYFIDLSSLMYWPLPLNPTISWTLPSFPLQPPSGGCMEKPSAPFTRSAAFCLASAAWPLSPCLAWCALWKSATRSMVRLQKEPFLTQWNDTWINCHVPKRPIVDWSPDEKGNIIPL